MIDEKDFLQRLKKKYPKGCNEIGMEINTFVDTVETEINNQPQVQQWIPCSERLPKNQTELWWCTTEYLTCSKNGTIEVLCYCDGWNCSFLNVDMGVWRGSEIKDVIAWMPLPQPYTENRKES